MQRSGYVAEHGVRAADTEVVDLPWTRAVSVSSPVSFLVCAVEAFEDPGEASEQVTQREGKQRADERRPQE